MLRLALVFCLAACTPGQVLAADPAVPASLRDSSREFRRQVPRLVDQLDSDRFDVRCQAAARLESMATESMATEPRTGRLLAVELERVLVLPNVSFEVRRRLEQLRRRLPKVAVERAKTVSPEEIDHLVRQLEDESYGVRLSATKRLEWLLDNPELSVPIMLHLKRRLARGVRTADIHRRLLPIYEQARGVWLASDPAGWKLPDVPEEKKADEEITRWIDQLAAPSSEQPDGNTRSAARAAERELSDLLARDELVPRVRRALETRLAGAELDPWAAGRLKKLLDLTRPAMVAEYWQGRHNLGEQHLLIGVPSLGPGAKRPSHFDRIDDKTAHCVSGNSLSPGDYPVGVAFPHPQRPGPFFHLVNLPTPRHRMAYPYRVKTDETTRLATISRRTLDRILTSRRGLSDAETIMLGQLDQSEVSRFAGKYFALVEDSPTSAMLLGGLAGRALAGRPSRHGAVCMMLATEGTNLAIPGLLDAIGKDRFLPPTTTGPYQFQWLAALAIAARDPWPEVDAWLASLIGRADPLVIGRRDATELGATAAALLLKRHRQPSFQFGLEPVADPLLGRLGLEGYRRVSPDAQKKMHNWWRHEVRGQGSGVSILRVP